jgi:hypothetical protein
MREGSIRAVSASEGGMGGILERECSVVDSEAAAGRNRGEGAAMRGGCGESCGHIRIAYANRIFVHALLNAAGGRSLVFSLLCSRRRRSRRDARARKAPETDLIFARVFASVHSVPGPQGGVLSLV